MREVLKLPKIERQILRITPHACVLIPYLTYATTCRNLDDQKGIFTCMCVIHILFCLIPRLAELVEVLGHF